MRKQLKRWYKEWPPRKGQSGETVPHYCPKSREWRCRIGKNEVRGSIEIVFEELTRFCEVYDYLVRDNQTTEESWHDHFYSKVMSCLIQMPEHFRVEGFEEQYSKQQIELIKAVQEKLLAAGKQNEYSG